MDFDQQLFVFINELPHNSVLDAFFWLIHVITHTSLIFVVVIVANLLSKDGRRKKYALLVAIAMVLTLAVVDLILKPVIQRDRPIDVMDVEYVIGSVPGSFSFPSGQTALAFCFAMMSFLMLRDRWDSWLVYLLALLTAFDRVYVGHHFPSDVLAGMVVGVVVAFVVWLLGRRFRRFGKIS